GYFQTAPIGLPEEALSMLHPLSEHPSQSGTDHEPSSLAALLTELQYCEGSVQHLKAGHHPETFRRLPVHLLQCLPESVPGRENKDGHKAMLQRSHRGWQALQ